MIDSKFFERYTTGLYAVPPEHSPTYTEFRDMFSSGQLRSKEWLDNVLHPHLRGNEQVLIVGSWFGTLGLMLKQRESKLDVILLDKDPRCKIFVDNIAYWVDGIKSITEDMFNHKYESEVVINTSCEHITDLKGWLSLLPKGTLVALQSNNNDKIADHINCSNSVKEFSDKVGLTLELYSGEYIMPMYTRYMVVGYT